MSDTVVAETIQNESSADAESKKTVGIIGVPLAYGASMAGVELGPAALRVARLVRRITQLGYKVRDLGDLEVEEEQSAPAAGEKLKYVAQISRTCEELAQKVEEVLNANELPVVLGGDHSIAIGSLSGVSSHCPKHEQQ